MLKLRNNGAQVTLHVDQIKLLTSRLHTMNALQKINGDTSPVSLHVIGSTYGERVVRAKQL